MRLFSLKLRIIALSLVMVHSAISCSRSAPGWNLFGLFSDERPFQSLSFNFAGSANASFYDIITHADLATSSVSCAFHDVNLGSVIDALHRAKARGLSVKVALDERNRDAAGFRLLSEFLLSSGIERELWAGNKAAGVFSNFCIFDNKWVWLSSAAPTVESESASTSFSMLLKDEETGIVSKFASDMDLMVRGTMGSAKQRLNQRNYWTLNGKSIGVYFSPQERFFENYLSPRFLQARSHIRLYSSEFYGNVRNSSTKCRTEGDLAYMIASSRAPRKDLYGSWYHYYSDDPDSSNINCAEYPNPKGNSFAYLKERGMSSRIMAGDWPVGGMHAAVFDDGDREIAVLSSHPYRRGSYDGFSIVLEHKDHVDQVKVFLDNVHSRSVNESAAGSTASPLDVVISEINWGGGFRKDSSRTKTQYIELFNNTDRTLNLSSWEIQCKTTGPFVKVFTVPAKTLIGPSQYLLISPNVSSTTQIVKTMHVLIPTNVFNASALSPDTQQCRLLDVNSNEIDLAGENGFAFKDTKLKTGYLDATGVYRSMERTSLKKPGNTRDNWHTNSHGDWRPNHNFVSTFAERTFGTPGYRNSSPGSFPETPPDPRLSLRINEIGYNIGGNSNNRFVEIKNNSGKAVNLKGMYLRRYSTNACNAIVTEGDSPTHSVPLPEFMLQPGAIFTMVRKDSTLTGDFIRDDTLSGFNGCYALTIGNEQFSSLTASHVADFVAWGDPAVFKGSGAAPALINNRSISRCSDTENNQSDFLLGTHTAGAENVCSTGPDPRLHLRINEIGYDIEGNSNNRYIEIRNTGTASADLDGLYLRRYSDTNCNNIATTGNPTYTITLPIATVSAGGFYTVARDGAAITADLYKNDTMSTFNGCYVLTIGNAELRDINDPSVIDFVGWGSTVTTYKGTGPAPSLASQKAIARCTNTNNNAADFIDDEPTPGTANACTGPVDKRQFMRINELGFRINGNSDNNYIELKNTGTATANLNGLMLRRYTAANCASITTGTGTETRTLASVNVPAGGFYRIARSGSTLTADDTPSIGVTATEGCLVLYIGASGDILTGGVNDSRVVDFVGWGAAPFYKGTGPASKLGENVTLSRCSDTGNNAADFQYDYFSLGNANPCNMPTPNIWIAEVSTQDSTCATGYCGSATTAGTRDYILLYNPGTADVNIGGYKIERKTAAGDFTNTVTTLTYNTCANSSYSAYDAACIVPAKGFFLLTSQDYVPVISSVNIYPDFWGFANSIANTAQGIRIKDTLDRIHDVLCFGTHTANLDKCYGTPIGDPAAAQGVKRKFYNVNTQNNSADFELVPKAAKNRHTGGTYP